MAKLGKFLKKLAIELKSVAPSDQNFEIPCFFPNEDDVGKWLGYVEEIRKELKCTDIQILSRVRTALKQNAGPWCEHWRPDVRSWENFKRDIIEAYPQKKNLGILLKKVCNLTSQNFNTYAAYVHQKASEVCELCGLMRIS